MRQWDAGKKQGGTLQGGFLDFFRSWDPLTHFERFAFCFMLKPWGCCTEYANAVNSACRYFKKRLIMIDFKMWFDDDKITFHDQMTIYFSQANKNKALALQELLRITSDAAVEDYRQQGLSREFLFEHDYAILVSRVAFHFHRMPLENERIEVTTWEEKPELFQLKRAYEITSDSGERLVSGLSAWLLVNPHTRKIIPPKEFTLHQSNDYEKQKDCMKPGKIVLPKDMQKVDERIVRYSDLDSNGHTTNSRYGAFVVDALPAEYNEKELVDFRLNYSREALLGETLTMYASFDDTNKKVSMVGKTQNGSSFESELYYR